MLPLGPCAVPAPDRPAGITAVDGILPKELLFEVLLLLPAKEVCRVRAVCPSWRSLTYDPLFVAAHIARREGLLLAVPSRRGGHACVDLVELSGDVAKRIPTTTPGFGHRVLCARFNRVFVSDVNHRVSVVEPISGSVFTIRDGFGENLVGASGVGHPAWFAFGQVASTGDYKLLRIIEGKHGGDPACEVVTIGDGIGKWEKKSAGASHDEIGQWKKTESPQAYLDPSCANGVVVNGSAYFFFDLWQMDEPYISGYIMEPGCIPSFNLQTEHWSAALQGPLSQILEESDGMLHYSDLMDHIMLGELDGVLVTVHCNDRTSVVDFWFLVDIDSCVWSKKHKVGNHIVGRDLIKGVQPLLVLDDGGIILLVWTESGDIVQIFDPETKTTRNVNCICSAAVGIYTGSLLC